MSGIEVSGGPGKTFTKGYGDTEGTFAEAPLGGRVPENPYLAAAQVVYATSVPITDSVLPTGALDRKAVPIASGVIDYFPAALAEIARISKAGNDQHNPGEPLHWARGKSMDQADCVMRHFVERGTIDTDGLRHSAKMAWRALALLQLEMEEAGAPIARGAR